MPDRQWDYDARVHQYAREGSSGNGAARAPRGHAHSEASTGDAAAATNRRLRRPHLQSRAQSGSLRGPSARRDAYSNILCMYRALIPCLNERLQRSRHYQSTIRTPVPRGQKAETLTRRLARTLHANLYCAHTWHKILVNTKYSHTRPLRKQKLGPLPQFS